MPIGAITFITFIFFFKPAQRPEIEGPFSQRFLKLDLIGNFLIITSIVMILLALQWGGTTEPWSSARIIGLLVGGILEFIIFWGWQAYKGEDALIPLEMLRQRTVASSFGNSFMLSAMILIHSYYMPYWFQAVRFQSPVRSGVDFLPYVLSLFVLSFIAGAIVNRTGYFTPPAIIGPMVAIVGAGLLTSLKTDTPTGKWVGYQILTGGGVGIGYQQGIVAAQAMVAPELMSIVSNVVVFAQSLSGAIFVSVGNSILRNKLSSSLENAGFDTATIEKVLNAGATNVRDLIPPSMLNALLQAYQFSLDRVFIAGVVLCAFGWLFSLGYEWKSTKDKSLAGNERNHSAKVQPEV